MRAPTSLLILTSPSPARTAHRRPVVGPVRYSPNEPTRPTRERPRLRLRLRLVLLGPDLTTPPCSHSDLHSLFSSRPHATRPHTHTHTHYSLQRTLLFLKVFLPLSSLRHTLLYTHIHTPPPPPSPAFDWRHLHPCHPICIALRPAPTHRALPIFIAGLANHPSAYSLFPNFPSHLVKARLTARP